MMDSCVTCQESCHRHGRLHPASVEPIIWICDLRKPNSVWKGIRQFSGRKSEETEYMETWAESQKYELRFWKNEWAYRDLPREKLVGDIRLEDAKWFLRSMKFDQVGTSSFKSFEGRVLEIGCGPIGFFEGIENVAVKGIDSLMRDYSAALPFSILGKTGNYEDSAELVEDIEEEYDFAVCSNVLDHTGAWQPFLEACLDTLVPGTGRLLLFTHIRSVPAPGHTQVFSPSEVLNVLAGKGVQVIEHLSVHPDPHGHAESELYLRCIAPAN